MNEDEQKCETIIGRNNKKIGTVSLRDLCNETHHFWIPSYQRGYRWRTKHVQALINDLVNYETDKYCLQPIVLQKIDNCKNSFLIVDGQQRLTTLMLILKSWGIDNVWTMKNETELDESILSKKCKKNTELVAEEREKDKDTIIKRMGNIFFIWYLLETKEDGHEAFQRLNSGKIPLTSSELIRARMLGGDDNIKYEIAAEWERIEQRLRDDRFWFMFNSKPSESYTRIDRLFEIITNTEVEIRNDRFAPYYKIEKELNHQQQAKDSTSSSDYPDKINLLITWWDKVLKLFWTLEYCYADVELYHYIAWIRQFTNISFNSLYSLRCRGNEKRFKKELKKIIVKSVNSGCNTGKEFAEEIFRKNDYYSTSKQKLRSIFVLFNIEYLNNRIRNQRDELRKSIDYERFPFDSYSKNIWNIEHIDSYTENAMTSPKEQVEWAIETYIEFYKNTNSSEGNDILTWLSSAINERKVYSRIINDTLDKLNEKDLLKKTETENVYCADDLNNQFAALYKRLAINNNKIPEVTKNQLQNLTLLDEHTNKSYHNEIFPIKRRKIIETDQHNILVEKESNQSCLIFIPPCTRNVFTKYYTKYAVSITQWTNQDADAYKMALSNCFESLMESVNREEE